MNVDLFHIDTPVGTFRIRTLASTFDITLHRWDGCTYTLHVDDNDESLGVYDRPYGAVNAVAEHRTGIRKWDECDHQVSVYITDWTCDVDKRFKIQLVADYIERDSSASYREIVDYFEHKHGYLLDRMEIKDLYRELFMTGQTDKKLSDWMAPADMSDMPEIADAWLGD